MADDKPAKIAMAELMLKGVNWRAAAQQAGVETSQTSAYRFLKAYCLRGEAALEDRRHGRAYKVVGDVLVWLLNECEGKPEITAIELRTALENRFGVGVSKSQINRLRAAHGMRRPQKKQG